MPSKKAAAKKKTQKKTGSKAAGKVARKAPVSRSAAASRKKTGRQTESARKTTRPSAKKGTSKKTSSKKVGVKKKAVAGKSASKKTKSVSTKKVVAKPASSKKKVSSKSAAGRSKAAETSKNDVQIQPITTAQDASPATAPESTETKPARSVLFGPVRGFKPYEPKPGEPYMSPGQLEHFRNILLAWKRELMEEVDRTVLHMKDEAANFPDPNDRATQESEFGLELRTRDRERKLLKKIDAALQRIEDGTYGYCEETGDEIGLRRLEARPVATLCVEAQERRELAERQFRDREDYYR